MTMRWSSVNVLTLFFTTVSSACFSICSHSTEGCIRDACGTHEGRMRDAWRSHQGCMWDAWRMNEGCMKVASGMHEGCMWDAWRMHEGCTKVECGTHEGCMKVANNLLSSLSRFTISGCDSDCCSKSSDSSDCCSSYDCGVDSTLGFPRNSCVPLSTAHTIHSLTISHWAPLTCFVNSNCVRKFKKSAGV